MAVIPHQAWRDLRVSEFRAWIATPAIKALWAELCPTNTEEDRYAASESVVHAFLDRAADEGPATDAGMGESTQAARRHAVGVAINDLWNDLVRIIDEARAAGALAP